MRKTLVLSGLVAFVVTAVTTAGIFTFFNPTSKESIKIEHITSTPATQAVYTTDEEGKFIPLDFSKVAEEVMDAVVHIKSTQTYNNNTISNRQSPTPFNDLFGQEDLFQEFFSPRNFQQQPRNKQRRPQVKMGQGSGVIISKEGYIVTNNHVIADADDLEVTLYDNRTYKAKIVGTDPTTDLALIQIKENDLPNLPLVNSDEVKVGEWVMAVGNPFNLNSTVTAGIVSAKGRNINILKEQFAVESFIQTDAAINPGNSGGALVNLQGGLIGINTAIASPTGSYSGYGFAVPTNIVSKVVEDLMKYGVVQRGVLGVMIRTVDGNLKKSKDLEVMSGAYVDSLLANSAAGEAGIQKGDVILAINNLSVESSPKLQEIIARHRPGDKLSVKVNRKGTEKTFTVTLNNRKGNTNLVKNEHKEILSILGANLETLDKSAARKLDVIGGVKVKELYTGKLKKQTDIRPGFIITKIDGQKIKTMEELIKKLEDKKGGVLLEGIYEDIPGEFYYAFGL
ncbi:MAG: Do family serine endopeptidase [Saprospiraceae bacterium]